MNEIFNEIDCPVCGSNVFKNILIITPEQFLNDYRKKYYNLESMGINLDTKFFFQKCKNCSFVFVNPRINEKIYPIVYNIAKEGQYADKGWREGDNDLAKLFNTHSKFYASINLLEAIFYMKNRFNKLRNDEQKPITLLDYGCGFGHILDLCKPFGIEAVGVDIDERRIQFCKNKELNICKPDELSEDIKFDIIISWSVVEHINDLNQYFQYIYKHMNKGGIFMFNGLTPRIIFWERLRKKYRWVIPIEHINYFTRKSMHYMISKHGFAYVPKMKLVQLIDSYPRYFYPFAKLLFKGFYPNGILKMDLIKIGE